MIDFQSTLSQTQGMEFPLGVGQDGTMIKADLSRIHHLLVSGTTGAGKSVFVDSMLLSLIAHNSPEKLRFIFCDTRASEFSQYNRIGHTLVPVCTADDRICGVLQWVLYEGMQRLRTFSERNVKNLSFFNDNAWENFEMEMPRLVVVIDDLSEVLRYKEDVSDIIKRLFSIGRSVGIHLIAVTQTPAIKQTKDISALFYSKIIFLSTLSDLRFITGKRKPKTLSAVGDAWYCQPVSQVWIHVAEVAPADVHTILGAAASERHFSGEVAQKIIEFIRPTVTEPEPTEETDELLPAAVEVILETGQASVSMIERRLKLGYSRAARLVDRMEELGYVGPFEGSKPRQVLITRAIWREIQKSFN